MFLSLYDLVVGPTMAYMQLLLVGLFFAIVSSSAKLYSVSAKELTRDVPDLTAQDRMEWPSSDIGFKG